MCKEVIKLLSTIDYLSYIDMIQPLKNEEAEVVFSSEDGVIVNNSGTLFIAPFSKNYDALYEAMKNEKVLVSVHSKGFTDYLVTKGFELYTPCSLWVYDKKTIEYDKKGEIKPLDISHYDLVCEHYHLNDDPSYIQRRLRDGKILGLYIKDEIVGFVSTHVEGAMGMLEIFPEHQKKGYGALLESALIEHLLKIGEVPYCNVVDGNEASLNLQKKLGLIKAEKVSNWLGNFA